MKNHSVYVISVFFMLVLSSCKLSDLRNSEVKKQTDYKEKQSLSAKQIISEMQCGAWRYRKLECPRKCGMGN